LRDLIKKYCEDTTKDAVFKAILPMQHKDIVEEGEFNIAPNAGIHPSEEDPEKDPEVRLSKSVFQFLKYRQNLKSMNANFIDSFAMFIAGSISLQMSNGVEGYRKKGSVVAGLFRQFPLWMFELYLDGKDFDK
jgi:hypothetical protein